MNSLKKLRFGLLAVAALALVAASVPANAQQVLKATVELPFESQWGNSVVEPGQYKLTVEKIGGQSLIRLEGAVALSVFPGLSNAEPVADNGKLIFININGVNTLQSFKASVIGKEFTFPVHKAKGERAQLTTISVSSN
jgi:hypothetical protein